MLGGNYGQPNSIWVFIFWLLGSIELMRHFRVMRRTSVCDKDVLLFNLVHSRARVLFIEKCEIKWFRRASRGAVTRNAGRKRDAVSAEMYNKKSWKWLRNITDYCCCWGANEIIWELILNWTAVICGHLLVMNFPHSFDLETVNSMKSN